MRTLNWIRPVGRGQVAVLPRPQGSVLLRGELGNLRRQGVDVLVSMLTAAEIAEFDLQAEPAQCAEAGIVFRHFPIPDHSVPPHQEPTYQFLRELHAETDAGRGVALHCFAGVGRSVLMAASVMVLAGYPVDRVFPLLSAARGYPVPDTLAQRDWVEQFAALASSGR